MHVLYLSIFTTGHWLLAFLMSKLHVRNGTLVSSDSSGSVQFWDSHHGTLQQAHTVHKGDAHALAAVPSHNRVFSAGSDGQVCDEFLMNSNPHICLQHSCHSIFCYQLPRR